jgi:hypothetical protein
VGHVVPRRFFPIQQEHQLIGVFYRLLVIVDAFPFRFLFQKKHIPLAVE